MQRFIRSMQTSFVQFRQNHPLLWEWLWGWPRLVFAILAPFVFALVSIALFEDVNPWTLAVQMYETDPRPVTPAILMFLVVFQNWRYFRYFLIVLGAFLLILIAAAVYVQDIYHLPRFGPAFHYVFSSLFAIFYPRIEVDSGRIPDEEHVLNIIGGPGFAGIQPASAGVFRAWRQGWQEPSEIILRRRYFMRPFKAIRVAVSLEDYHGEIDEMRVVTRDGIRLHLRKIQYRFRVSPRGDHERPIPRSLDEPYPLSEDAILNIAHNLSAIEAGRPEHLHEAIRRLVQCELINYISSHDIDYLTAPRQDGRDPRRELRLELFDPGLRSALRKVGAELLWIDAGHIDIDRVEREEGVDEQRLDFWAAEWVGNAQAVRAYGEAKRVAYQELGRAEAQAELIMSITDALQGVDLSKDPIQNLRNVLLVRTAQILEAMRDVGRRPAEEK